MKTYTRSFAWGLRDFLRERLKVNLKLSPAGLVSQQAADVMSLVTGKA